METTIKVHQKLKQIAYDYMQKLIKLNNTGDESQWILTPGTYKAVDLAKRVMAKDIYSESHAKWIFRGSKHIASRWYMQPDNYEEIITISEGSFKCSFKLEDIFVYLHGWEQLPEIKAKDKFSFEVAKEDGGELECIKAPVYYCDAENRKLVKKLKTLVHFAGQVYILKSDYAKWEHDLITFIVKVGDVYFVQSEKQHTKNTILPLTKQPEECLYNFIERNKYKEQYNQLYNLIGDSYKPAKDISAELNSFIESVASAITAINALFPVLGALDAFLDAYTRFISVFNAMLQVESKLAEIGDILESVELDRNSVMVVCAQDANYNPDVSEIVEPTLEPNFADSAIVDIEPVLQQTGYCDIITDTQLEPQISAFNASSVQLYSTGYYVPNFAVYVGNKPITPPGQLYSIRGPTIYQIYDS